jgi:glycosyltransferase involved in cell wall biosynthesis
MQSWADFHKIERTQAFYRIHAQSKTADWPKFLIELYRWSRPRWPGRRSAAFYDTAKAFLKNYLVRRFPAVPRRHRVRPWIEAIWVAGMVFLGLGNPEERLARVQRRAPGAKAVPIPPVARKRHETAPEVLANAKTRYHAVFCSFLWPLHPGHSGGEIRDLHILRRLVRSSRVEFVAASDPRSEDRLDPLRPAVESVHHPSSTARDYPEHIALGYLRRSLRTRALGWLRGRKVPVIGPKYHADISQFAPVVLATCVPLVKHLLETQPDFLFVSPQLNPLALMLHSIPASTRLILATYDVERARIASMAEANRGLARVAMILEAKRSRRFERDNIAKYDGMIAVSRRDRDILASEYGYPVDRILVIENSVDTSYFSYSDRETLRAPNIVFVGSLLYWPNEQAAIRLLRRIVPIVRRTYPEARAWIVGGNPTARLTELADGILDIVTGPVSDVRPYLDSATVVCVPLESGSGTKYKVLEALSAGAPVVSTPLALEGLDHLRPREHLQVATTDLQFAETIIRAIKDPESMRVASRRARQVIEEYYSWDTNLAPLDAWLDFIHSLPRHGRAASRR